MVWYNGSTMRMKEATNIKDLAQEVSTLRSFVIGLAGKDSEGEYRPEFVEKVLKSSADKPTGTFRNANEFLVKLNTK